MKQIKKYIPYIYTVCSFGIIDVWLRVVTRWIGAYSIFEIAPNAFTLCWAIVLSGIIMLIPNKKAAKFTYGILYFVWMIYAIVQYGCYLILDKFLFLSDFLLAGEGLDYTSYILAFLDVKLILQIFALLIVGIIGIWVCEPLQSKIVKKFAIGGVLTSILVMWFLPKLYGETTGEWNDFESHAFEYERFVNATYDVELTGIYQFVFRDASLLLEKQFENYDEEYALLDEYFNDKTSFANTMTNIFKDKNVLIVMLESIDDWVINKEDTPTMQYMKERGINFEEMYTPQYSNGYTFNTEFAFNTSVYPYSNGNVAYSLSKNIFSNSLPTLFEEAGYAVNSFHVSEGTFYNRAAMHDAWGYEYHTYFDYPKENVDAKNDVFLTISDSLWKDVTQHDKFMSFIITYSAHLPYEVDEFVEYAAEHHPQYDKEELTPEECLRAKATITDDMFAEMLRRLEEDGLLENTVIVAFTDHYAYGLNDDELLFELSEEAGNSILENTPAFIYSADYDNAIEVNKVCQITDLGPTIANMFGLRVPTKVMGRDIFDENYEGYAIFPNNTWITESTYMKNGNIIWDEGMTEEEIQQMNAMVKEQYEINDLIL